MNAQLTCLARYAPPSKLEPRSPRPTDPGSPPQASTAARRAQRAAGGRSHPPDVNTKLKRWPAALILPLVLAAGCGGGGGGAGDGDDGPEGAAPGVEAQIRDLYQRARSAGERVPEDAYDWAREDISRIGDWEYQVLGIDEAPGEPGDDAALQARLNALGAERWEVFWIDARGDRLRVFLKRPARSYLRHIPFSTLGRWLHSGGSGGEE